jgi:DNA-binding XRE family transcriptional regulator
MVQGAGVRTVGAHDLNHAPSVATQCSEYNFLCADSGTPAVYRIPLGAIQTDQREIGRRIGLAVRAERERLGLTQEELAHQSDHHRNYIGYLERGERCPNVATLERIARVLKLRVSELLARAGF